MRYRKAKRSGDTVTGTIVYYSPFLKKEACHNMGHMGKHQVDQEAEERRNSTQSFYCGFPT